MKRTDDFRFQKFVRKGANDDCDIWIGGKVRDGYGRFRFEGKAQLSHRASYKLYRGELSDEIQVLHHCDNPACVRPSHLFLGTQLDNIRDMRAKNRHKNPPSGINHNKAVLNPEKAFEIRWLSAMGYSRQKVADMYGVTKPNIKFIVQNKTWRMECHD